MGLLSRLSRISSSGRFIPQIDGLRFVAIAAVVLHHLAQFMAGKAGRDPDDPLFLVVIHGFFGVQLFFVISGFILSLPFAEAHLDGGRRPGLGRYYGRRLTRLEPPYFINLALLFGMTLLLRGAGSEGLWPHFWASLGYVHNLAYSAPSAINTVAWSLEIEIQFYAIAPFLTMLFAIRNAVARRLVLIGLAASAALVTEPWRSREIPLLSYSLAGHLQYFLLGFLLADWYLIDWKRSPVKGFAWDLFGALAWGALGIGLIKVGTPRVLLLPLILIAYVAAFRGRILGAFFGLPWITTIGGMCYTIYLYHYYVIEELGRLTWRASDPSGPFWLNFLFQLGLVGIPLLAISVLLFALFERPFMRPGWYNRAGHPP